MAITTLNSFYNYARSMIARLVMIYVGSYVEGLDINQISTQLLAGTLRFTDLRIKKSALDKFEVPFEVVEGRIGLFSIGLDLYNLSLKIGIEDVHVLVASAAKSPYSPEEEEERAQAIKLTRLDEFEQIHASLQLQTEQQKDSQHLGAVEKVIEKVINNAQVTIKNIHLRFEDAETVPGHPFAAGITLASLEAVTTDQEWKLGTKAEGDAQTIYKLVSLDSLALYFNTDCESISGLEYNKSKEVFRKQIPSKVNSVEHQFMLKPISGEGRIVLNKQWGKGVPHYEATLMFRELAFALDKHQYQDVISLADVYHIYARQHKYRKYRPDKLEFAASKPKALLKFATTAILEEVHDKHQRWTWHHFKERRDDRYRYIELFKKKSLLPHDATVPEELSEGLATLERKLSYHDIRFYRSIARMELKKDPAAVATMNENKKRQEQKSSWTSWLWGSSSEPSSKAEGNLEAMTDEQLKGLYEVIDYDEKSAIAESFEKSQDSIIGRGKVKLEKGSFRLKGDSHAGDIISLLFDSFEFGGTKRPENFEASISLGNFKVFDGTTSNTLYNQIVHVKENRVEESDRHDDDSDDKAFFSLKFEYKPLDERADNGLSVFLSPMEIIYQRGYLEAVVDFFKPPESQLQSVEALLSVASETLEGIQKETRAGLEYALETHKTIDLRLDMHAPIIIIPESVTQEHCNHLIIDAGRVIVKSKLADKAALREIEKKRNRQYTDDDYKELEALMYDNYEVSLTAAQFVIGENLDICRHALQSETPDPRLHLLERVNIGLTAQNSIVPSAKSIPRLRMLGRLPQLHLNFSDTKYKTLMRLLDVAIPRFGDDADLPPSTIQSSHPEFVSSELFQTRPAEYSVDESEDKDSDLAVSVQHSELERSTTQDLRQHLFEFHFGVDALQITILKAMNEGSEQRLGDLRLEGFSLQFSMAKLEMKVDVRLRSIILTSISSSLDTVALVSTELGSSGTTDLMEVAYRRVQKSSPDFISVYNGFDQSVEVKLSTFIFRAVPEHVLSLYDYLMTTFVPDRSSGNPTDQPKEEPEDEIHDQGAIVNPNKDRIRVRANLASFEVLLIDGETKVATLSLSTANVEVSLDGDAMDVNASMGNLLLIDDSVTQTQLPEFKQLLSIEGDNLAQLRYQKFDAENSIEKGISSSIELRTGSLKFHFLVSPMNSIYIFLLKFARLKAVYDTAAEAAVQSASGIERMGFELFVRAPIIVVPIDPIHLEDRFSMKLGEITAQNSFDGSEQTINASLTGLQMTSVADSKSRLKIIDDVTITTKITQTSVINRREILDTPDFKISVGISDVKLHLTEQQYCQLIILSRSIPNVFKDTDTVDLEPKKDNTVEKLQESDQSHPDVPGSPLTSLQPELVLQANSEEQLPWLNIDFLVTMQAVKLHLYDSSVIHQTDLKDHGIVRFAINGGRATLKMLSDGSMESEFAIKSFTMSNTRPGLSRFREIIPAASHGRNQVMVLYTMSGGVDKSALAVITVDSPQIVFSLDPVYAVSSFFLSAFSLDKEAQEVVPTDDGTENTSGPQKENSVLHYRFDLHDASIVVLENDEIADSQAIRLSLKQISLSQQEVLALFVSRLGMSLVRMDKPTDSIRFLDDLDISMTLELHQESSKQFTGIQLMMQPVVFRSSYRDILLIMSIANRAIALFSANKEQQQTYTQQSTFDSARAIAEKDTTEREASNRSIALANTSSKQAKTAKVVVSSEELSATLDGFRLVLIGDLHEMPMLNLETKPFSVSVSDWSAKLHASTTISTAITFWNLKNSHWEPLIDPWTFSVVAVKESVSDALNITMSSQSALDVNLTSNFMELAVSTARIWNKEGDQVLKTARGSYAPYRILNKTGDAVSVWSDLDGSVNANAFSAVKVGHNESVEWRFDDWKTTREHVSTTGTNAIGVRFDNKPWEQLRSIPVDREGEYIYSLRPRTSRGSNKLMCEIIIKDNVKIVTLRSTYKVQNQTFYPLEVALVDSTGHPVSSINKIAPGEYYGLPIEATSRDRIRIQPDPGFGYRWSPSLWWEDLRETRFSAIPIACPHVDRKEPPFNITLWPIWSSGKKDYPQLTLTLRAPIELENLLPYDLQYRVFDKDSGHNWSSYLRKGGVAPVHSVELSHLVLLSITVQDTVFKASDFTIINADRRFEFDQENYLTLSDAQDRKLQLSLNYIKHPESGGAFRVQIYSPYIVINKTGLAFGVRSVRSAGLYRDVAGENRIDELSKSTPFMLSHYNKKGNEFVFRIGDSGWSKTIRFDVPSAETSLEIPSVTQKVAIHCGLSWVEGTGKYKLTKVIELSPRFIIYNKLSRSVCFREHGAPPSGRSELGPGEQCPLQSLRNDERKLLTLAYPGLNAHWSPPVDMEAMGSVHVRMRPAGSTAQNDVHLTVANVILEKATIYVILSPHEGPWPFIIENESDYEVTIGQTDDLRELLKPDVVYRIKPHSRLAYAWDFPAASNRKIYLNCNKGVRLIDIMEIGVLPPLKHKQGTVSLDVRADKQTQVLTISTYREEASLYKPKRRSTVSSTRSDVNASSQEFEVFQEDVPPSFRLYLDMKALGVSLVDKRLVEVIYFSVKSLKVEYANSPVAQSLDLAFGELQVDNQLHDAFFPIVLEPTPLPKDTRRVGALPTLQASVIVLNDEAHGVLFVKYASILLQAITVQIDEAFLYAVMDLVKLDGIDWDADTESVLVPDLSQPVEPELSNKGQDVYFEVLELQPIRLSVSFVRNINPTGEETQKAMSNPLAAVFDIVLTTLANAEGIDLKLNALGLTDIRLTTPELQQRIVLHYRQEVLRQIYRVIGSADFLGNPVGLFTNVSSGVADIFYEPWNGVVQHGGGELGLGIAKGAASFVKKTVFGVSDSVTKLTSTIGKGKHCLSAVTFDPEYQAKRQMAQRRNKPRHALMGLSSGAEAFATAVTSGMEGLVSKPFEGAETEGTAGFLKGIGKGFVGLVAKPVGGIADFASNVSEGIRNTTTVFDQPKRERVRKPRLVPGDGVLQPYQSREALGQFWMRDLQEGKYRKEFYIAHLDLPGSDEVVLLTNARILKFTSKYLRVLWDMPLTNVAGVQAEHTGIQFTSKSGREYDKSVIIQDRASKDWFFEKVKAVVVSYNARRRLER